MNFGIFGGVGYSDPPELPPGASGNASNGLSIDPVSGDFVLGNDVAAAGSPAQLVSVREIELQGFEIDLVQVAAQLKSELLAGGAIYQDNANGLQSIISSTGFQGNSNAFGGVVTLQAADPVANPKTFLSLVDPNGQAFIEFPGNGTPYRIEENNDGLIITDGTQIFFFDITNRRLRIYETGTDIPGGILAGQEVTQVLVGTTNVGLADSGRMYTNFAIPNTNLLFNAPLGVPGFYFDLNTIATTGAGVTIKVQFQGFDKPAVLLNIGSSSGHFDCAAGFTASARTRFYCVAVAGGGKANWYLMTEGAYTGGWSAS